MAQIPGCIRVSAPWMNVVCGTMRNRALPQAYPPEEEGGVTVKNYSSDFDDDISNFGT